MASADACDLPNEWMRNGKAHFPFVKDAIKRWAAKGGRSVEAAMNGRSIDIVFLPDKECVSFGLDTLDVGGIPTYCYRPSSTNLIWEQSNVE